MSTLELALQELYERALPAHIPGAWIRDAIERMRQEEGPEGRITRMESDDFAFWAIDSLLDHLCELATDSREQLFTCGSVDSETTARVIAVRSEIQSRARVAQGLVS